MDDVQAIEACLSGRPEQFRPLFDRYRQRAYRLAFSLVQNADDALDVCQEAFLKAFRNLRRFDLARPFAPWLYRIVRNSALDLLRRRGSAARAAEPEQSDLLPAPEHQTPEHQAQSHELARRLRLAMAGLSREHREVFVLREVHDLSYNQIAEVVGVPRGTVMSRLFHARRALRRQLEEWL